MKPVLKLTISSFRVVFFMELTGLDEISNKMKLFGVAPKVSILPIK